MVGVSGFAMQLMLYFIFTAIGLDTAYIDKGILYFAVNVLSWVLPYPLCNKFKKYVSNSLKVY